MTDTDIANFGKGHGRIAVRSVPPGPPSTYLGVAHSMVEGVRILANASPPSILALALVAAHVLECTLTAYLSRAGDDSSIKKNPKLRHNISALWSLVHNDGLPIPASMPAWAAILSQVHDRPFHLRYSTGVHAFQVPSAEPMATELQSLLDLVQSVIENGRHNGAA